MPLTSVRAVLLATALCMLAAPGSADAPAPGAAPRTFEIVASKFKFEPAVIEVAEGDRVALNVRSADGVHGIGIKEFKVKRRVPKGGAAVSVEFVADKAGTFRILCSEYCGNGHSRMKATLVVHPRSR